MKTSIQHFIISLLFTIVLPLLPIFLEVWYSGFVRERTLTMAAAMYAVAKGVTSDEPIIFGFSLFITIFLVSIYGSIPNTSHMFLKPSIDISYQLIIILSVAISHAAERYTLHVINKKPFIAFKTNGQ